MKVLFLYSYYKPEKTSGAHLAQDLREGLAAAGHTMEIYTPTPTRGVSDDVRREYKSKKNEKEMDGSVKVHRFALFREGENSLLRTIRYAICEVQLLWFGLIEKKTDLIPLGSTPPINGIVGTILKKLKKTPYVYTVQDVFPESLVSAGLARKDSLLWKIGSWVSDLTYRNAREIIVISDSMKENLVRKGVPADKITVVYNWIDSDSVHPVARENNTLFDEFSLPRDKFYVTYAGNLGNTQNVGLIVDAAERLRDNNDIRFVIFGDGSEKEKLTERIAASGLDNIRLFPMQPFERVSEVYSLGDASFVICRRGAGEGAFPSKAASIMATGTPVIASFDKSSDLCRIIDAGDVGVCAEPEDADDAVRAICRLYSDRALCEKCAQNGLRLVKERFSKQAGVGAYVRIYERAAERRN